MLKIINDRYSVDEYGGVFDKYNKKYLKHFNNGFGYEYVMLSLNGKYKQYKVHRLVAKAFIPNPNDYLIINHKDENPKNNVVDNLEWCDSKYNNNYGSCKKKISIANSIKINQYDLDGKFIKQWIGIRNISKETNINKGNICSCCKGKRNNAGGFVWRYVND